MYAPNEFGYLKSYAATGVGVFLESSGFYIPQVPSKVLNMFFLELTFSQVLRLEGDKWQM